MSIAVVTALINEWSTTETLGIVASMLGGLAAAIYRRQLAGAIANLNVLDAFPPPSLPREERSERTTERRERHNQSARIMEFGILLVAVLLWVFGPLALIDGRDGPVFDALF